LSAAIMLGTTVVTAISEGVYPSGPIIPTSSYPIGPARSGILEAPLATSGNNEFMVRTNNDTEHRNV
jgi:hypothetical protein